jgi:hypothetical protein
MSRNTTLKTLVLGATDLDDEFKKVLCCVVAHVSVS